MPTAIAVGSFEASTMTKLNRRNLLLGGVALGGAIAVGKDYQHYRQTEQLSALARQQIQSGDQASLLEAAFQADANKIYQGQEIINSLNLTPPQIPYDRTISRFLIRCSKIATQQYLTGKTIASYDGGIKQLPAYTPEFDQYTQITAFRGKEAQVSESVEVQLPAEASDDPLDRPVNEVENQISNTLRQVVTISQDVPVYLGFVLRSPQRNIIVFRGTQTAIEWINNLRANQIAFTDRQSGQYFGKIHDGFIKNYLRIIDPIPKAVAQQLDPTVPCYITGHSLGASLAVLAALDIAVNLPGLKPQIQLYTYACPRVGDPVFAKLHARYVPNSYRIANLADTIPLLPPTKAIGTYVHVGENWSFLSQGDDIMPNHVVDTYQTAVDRGVETHQKTNYPVSGT
jgi:predicted lipase